MQVSHFNDKAPHAQFFIHFDVSDHHIKLDTFIETAKQVQNIINEIGKTFLGEKLNTN